MTSGHNKKKCMSLFNLTLTFWVPSGVFLYKYKWYQKKTTYFSPVKTKYNFVLQKKAFIEHLCIKNWFHFSVAGEYRSRTCTMTTDRSQLIDHRRHASITDINTDTIIQTAKPSLANIGKRASRGDYLLKKKKWANM